MIATAVHMTIFVLDKLIFERKISSQNYFSSCFSESLPFRRRKKKDGRRDEIKSSSDQ